jgi:hypothetical protein
VIVADVEVMFVEVKPVEPGQVGGVQVKVKPELGVIAVVNVQLALFVKPVVVADQFVVVVLLAKAAFDAPLKPTSLVLLVAF